MKFKRIFRYALNSLNNHKVKYNALNPIKKEITEIAEEFPPIRFFQLYRYTTNFDKFLIFLGIISTIVTSVCQSINIISLGGISGDFIKFASQISSQGAIDELEGKLKLFVIHNTGFGLLTITFTYISILLFSHTGIKQSYKIRSLYLERILNQDIAWHDKHSSADFASRMTDDIGKLEEGIGEKLATYLNSQLCSLTLLIFALLKGWKFTLICLISVLPTILILKNVFRVISKFSKKAIAADGEASRVAEEALASIRTVFAFGGQYKELNRFKEKLVFAKNNKIKRALWCGLVFGFAWFIRRGGDAFALWYGVGLFIGEKSQQEDQLYTSENITAILICTIIATVAFGMTTPYLEVLCTAKAAAGQIYGIIDNKPIINAAKGAGKKPDKVFGNISFKNVSFSYPNRLNKNVLAGFNLNIKEGDTVALVGKSGCGKSTCIQLFQRFYDPLNGTITLDDNNLQDLDLTWLRNNIGVVGQEPVLFGASILDNIKYGFQNATNEDIISASKMANAHEFISALPQGYDTMVGELGAQLSGGQKQRIAIARAIVKKPAILLLDEATSALDIHSETKVQAAIENVSKECTTVIVAHRLSTIRRANKIVVLNKGIAVEEGSHEELMKKQAKYFKLFTHQITKEDKHKDETRVEILKTDGDDDYVDTRRKRNEEVVEKIDDKTLVPSLWQIISYNKSEKLELLIGCICALLGGISIPCFSIVLSDIAGVLSNPNEGFIKQETNKYCLIFVGSGVVLAICSFLRAYMFGIAGENLTMRIKSDIFEAMLNQEIGWYDRKNNGVGALCVKLAGEPVFMRAVTTECIGAVFQSSGIMLFVLSMAMYHEWRLGLVAMAFLPPLLCTTFLQKRLEQKEAASYRLALEGSTRLAMEAVGNIRTVASLGSEKMMHKLYLQEIFPYTKIALKNAHLRAFVIGVANSIKYFALAICINYGGYLVINEGLFFGKVLKISYAVIIGAANLMSIFSIVPNIEKGFAAGHQIFKMLARIPKMVDAPSNSNKNWQIGDIRFSKVYFSYPTRPSVDVLKGLDLSVFNGKTVALVGPSGSGKSTIVQLLERYYDYKSGSISVNGQDLQSIKFATIRSKLGIVSQEPNLFDRSIIDNIKYGDNSREVGVDEVIAAAIMANIHNFITSLPLGYNTCIGTKGVQLSGGQKQRIAIARALVRNPKVLILDEATSALDTESEKLVQGALDKAKQGRTCIIIAHKLSTIQGADLICVINKGVVVEMGTHTELLSQRGHYHSLYSLQ